MLPNKAISLFALILFYIDYLLQYLALYTLIDIHLLFILLTVSLYLLFLVYCVNITYCVFTRQWYLHRHTYTNYCTNHPSFFSFFPIIFIMDQDNIFCQQDTLVVQPFQLQLNDET
jgi:hypothetical protein